jgi:tetratricopeptide (TPR) repeat protein
MSYLFNDYEGIKDGATRYFEIATKPSWMLLVIHSAHAFFGALASYRLLRETRDPVWAARAKKFHSAIQLWAEQGSSWNWRHKAELLTAEEHYCNGNFGDAQVAYTNAISNAATSKFINDEAIASERAADFYLKQGNTATALEYYTRAHSKYSKWGASAKAQRLYESLRDKIPGLINI